MEALKTNPAKKLAKELNASFLETSLLVKEQAMRPIETLLKLYKAGKPTEGAAVPCKVLILGAERVGKTLFCQSASGLDRGEEKSNLAEA